jgi:hypothetical protein
MPPSGTSLYAPKRDLLEQDDIIAHNGCFANHNPHPMVNHDPTSQLSTRVNFDTRDETTELGKQPRGPMSVVLP